MNGLERFFESLPTHPALLLTATLALLALCAWAADRLTHLLLHRPSGERRWTEPFRGYGPRSDSGQ